MADTRLYLQTQKFTLKNSISLSDTSIELTSFNLPDGTAIASGDLGSINYATIAPGTANEEQISFTGLTGTTLTGVTRGLRFDAPYTADTGLRKSHSAGTTLVLSNTAAFYDNFVNKGNDETMSGYLGGVEPTASEHFATKNYVDTNVNGGAVSMDAVSVAGTAGETVSAGQLVYFDDTDNEWKLCDADTATTVDDVLIGIAQGAGTDGNAISGGVLLRGLDANQTGLTVGVVLYVGNTAGAISESAGTTERVIGWSKSATEVYFDPVHATNPTANEKDAMAGGGDFGTPSSSNKYLTQTYATRTEQVTFNSSGTWTKDTGLTRVRVQAWGGGGSGGSRTSTGEAAGGGGGGGYAEKWFEAADLGATETVTIGAGGTGVSGDSNGGAGGSTTFGSLLTAYGGGRGGSDASTAGGGGGGGSLGAGGNGSTSNGTAGSPGSPLGGTGDGSAGHLGGGGGNSATNVGGAGGDAYWGGAGGGGSEATSGAGGTSVHGGNGGAGSNSGNGTAGTQPGGGGGASSGSTSGAGGDGRVIVTEFYT